MSHQCSHDQIATVSAVGLDEFDPNSATFRWDGTSNDIVIGFSHEDRCVYKVYSPSQQGNSDSYNKDNNLASQFLMKPNSVGNFVIYKTESGLVDGDETSAVQSAEGTDAAPSENSVDNDGTVYRHIKITRREVWEITEYRHFCSFDKVVSDRVHRANMQRGEGLKALKQTKFTVI